MYFSYDVEDGFQTYDTEEEARNAAIESLELERGWAQGVEWSDDVEEICWGEISERVKPTKKGVEWDFELMSV